MVVLGHTEGKVNYDFNKTLALSKTEDIYIRLETTFLCTAAKFGQTCLSGTIKECFRVNPFLTRTMTTYKL